MAVVLLRIQVRTVEVHGEHEPQAVGLARKRAVPHVAVPDDQRAHRRLDGDRRVRALPRARLARVPVAARHHGEGAVVQRVVGQQEGAVAGVGVLPHGERVHDRRVGMQAEGRAVAFLVAPFHERRAARDAAVEPQHVGLQGQQVGVADRLLEDRVLQQQVVEDVLVVERRLDVEVAMGARHQVVLHARPAFRDLEHLVPESLDPGDRRRLPGFEDREPERVEFRDVLLESELADLAIERPQFRRRLPVSDLHLSCTRQKGKDAIPSWRPPQVPSRPDLPSGAPRARRRSRRGADG